MILDKINDIILSDNEDLISEAFPNLPRGYHLSDKDSMITLKKRNIGGNTKWKKIRPLSIENIRPTMVFMGIAKSGGDKKLAILGFPEAGFDIEDIDSTPSILAYYILPGGESKQFMRTYENIKDKEGIKRAIKNTSVLEDLALRDFNWFTAEPSEVIKPSQERGAVLNYSTEIRVDTEKVIDILTKNLPKVKREVTTNSKILIDEFMKYFEESLFAVPDEDGGMQSPDELRYKYASKIDTSASRYRDINYQMYSMIQSIKNNFGTLSKKKGLTHTEIKMLNSMIKTAIGGITRV